MAKEKYIIKASVKQRLDSVDNFRGQKVLRYFDDETNTPKEWIEMEAFDNYEDAQEALYQMARHEVGAVEKDYNFILSEVQNSDDLKDIKETIENYFEDGDGIYINDKFAMSKTDDSYTLDGVTYSVEFVETPKKAFLVTASVCTRVVVDADATDEEIMDLAKARLLNNLNSDFYDNIEEIVEDRECPYGTFDTDKK